MGTKKVTVESEVDRLARNLDSIRKRRGEDAYRDALSFVVEQSFINGMRSGLEAAKIKRKRAP